MLFLLSLPEAIVFLSPVKGEILNSSFHDVGR